MKKRLHAEIAGAGFAGLATAIALRQRDWSVRVHEADSELRAFGAGIFIWENGLRVLKALGAYDDVLNGAHQAPFFETRLQNATVSKEVFGEEKGSRMMTMTRQNLYLGMLKAAQRLDVEFVTNSAATAADPEGLLRLSGDKSARADLVVGADGVRSSVRDSLDLLAERNKYTDGIIRLLAPRMLDRLGEGSWDNVIDFWHLDPRILRVLYVPCNKDELYLAMMAPKDDLGATAIPIQKDIWLTAFPQLEPVISAIGGQGRYDAYETTKLKRWSCGRVAIVGDAAHAMAPTLGQGAGCAMMNALGLAVALEETSTIEDGLSLWERRERPLTERTQEKAAHFAKTRKMSGGNQWDAETLETATHIPTGTR